MKEIKLKLTDYYIIGTSFLVLWSVNDEVGSIEMKPFHVESIKDIVENINDNGFGCQRIEKAVIEIYRNYEGHKIFSREIELTNEKYNLGSLGYKKKVS